MKKNNLGMKLKQGSKIEKKDEDGVQEISRDWWPSFSFYSLVIFANTTFFTIYNAKFNFTLYAIIVIVPMFFWPIFKLVIDKLYVKKIKEKWFRFPRLVHQGISVFCLFWSSYFLIKFIIPFLKKEYAKNK